MAQLSWQEYEEMARGAFESATNVFLPDELRAWHAGLALFYDKRARKLQQQEGEADASPHD